MRMDRMITVFRRMRLWSAAALVIWNSGCTDLASPRLVPVEPAWARNKVNATVFRDQAITSHGDRQYIAYYRPDGRLILACRQLGSMNWQIKETPYKGNIRDAHNGASIAVDGAGYLHVSWDHHGNPLHYAQSVSPGSLELTAPMPMTGLREKSVTYPQFYNLPDGGLLFLYRDGGSGKGDTMLNRYDPATRQWAIVQHPLISGAGQCNAYTNQIAMDRQGTWHISWNWRETGDVATNHDLCYAKSVDQGRTWQNSKGEDYQLPITPTSAEIAVAVPQAHEMTNMTSTVADSHGRPLFASVWRQEGEDVPQYRLVWHDGQQWRVSQVGNRKTPYRSKGGGTKRTPVSRPKLAIDRNDRVYMFYSDIDRGQKVSVAISDDSMRRNWRFIDLYDQDVGDWEANYDMPLWQRSGIFHLFLERVGQGDSEKLEDIPPQMIYVLQWRPE